MKNILKRLKRKVPVLAIALAFGALYACDKDFLDVEPQAETTEDTFFITEDDAIKSVNAIYGNLRKWEVAAFAHLGVTHVPSDDAEKGSDPGDAAFFNDFDNFTFSPTQFILDDYWTGQYQSINLTNQSITNIPSIEMDENLKNRLIAEAKFLRAHHYFNLVRAFGDVPLITKTLDEEPTPEELNPVRTPKEQVYAQIITDLDSAALFLPERYGAADVGRATKGAALTLLAKVHMYQKNWPRVLELTQQVRGLGYSLTPNYYDIFRISGENNSESIFEVQAQALPGNCGGHNSQWAEVQGVRGQFGWGFFTPTEDLEKAYEPNDKRKDATILFRGEVTPEGDKINDNAPNPRYNQKAYVPASQSRECGYGLDQNIRVLRYAEVLLMHAEAANELGQPQVALEALNQVRRRAGLADVTVTNQQQLREIIWHERRVELALESGDRFFDLVRQGRAAEVFQALDKNFVAGKHEVFAIPQRQIDLSAGRLTQNPGY